MALDAYNFLYIYFYYVFIFMINWIIDVQFDSNGDVTSEIINVNKIGNGV